MEKVWTISNGFLEIRFNETSGILSVTDKRIDKTWKQAPLKDKFELLSVTQTNNILSLTLRQNIEFYAFIEITDTSEVCITISAESGASLERLYYPPAFVTPNKDHYLLQTDSQGLLLPADDDFYPLEEKPFFICHGGPSMAWVGITDSDFKTGYMAIFETPFDAAVHFKCEEGLITFSPVWLSSMEQFRYERKIRYAFFDQGGYIAQCKRYREYIWPKNNVIPLKEKQRKFPAIEKMLGAVHIYVWDKAREVGFAQGLKEAGIDRALILWDANHIPYPQEDYDNHLKELGYGTGAYELFSDIHPDTHPAYNELPDIPLKRNVYPGLYDKLRARKKDGSAYSNIFGTHTCPKAIRPEMKKRIEKELASYPHETYFLDVWQANGLYECYSDEHPTTRQQYAEEIINNYKYLEESYNTYLGGEFGADFTGSYGIYNHGMMTLQRTWFNSLAFKEGTIYYTGDWTDNPRPTQMLGTRTASPTYLQYSMNEYTRVPLFELVYHDATVSSWRWEDGNHHCPEIWWKKDLFNILYGTAPLWSIDQDRWESYKLNFIESYRNVCPWLNQICYDEMVSHRFVTCDREVQETVFSSGKRVVVNFGDSPYIIEGQTIEPRGFITL